jgi:predicted Rossmann-fold nucleotide-binding protein
MAIEKLPVIGVMGSGREPHEEKAQLLGAWLAHEGVHLLTGGGKLSAPNCRRAAA